MSTHTHIQTAQLSAGDRTRLGRQARLLAGASVTYNVVECVIAVAAGLAAGSVALIGFGLDSLVEVSSGLIVLWQFGHILPESRERTAQRLMAVSFFALAAYVTFESARALIGAADPDPSPVGIALAIASLMIMPFLSYAQRRTGRALGSAAVVADSTQTLLCTYLLGWGRADPLAGLVIAAVAVREGREAWLGKGCCAPASSRDDADQDATRRDRHCVDGGLDACCATNSATGPSGAPNPAAQD